jgi:2-C-methyl-D-erythritol 4-phosphate cytidylyltransferase
VVREPQTPQPMKWAIYKVAAKQIWIGEIEATDEAEAIQKAAEQFKVPATKPMARLQRQ